MYVGRTTFSPGLAYCSGLPTGIWRKQNRDGAYDPLQRSQDCESPVPGCERAIHQVCTFRAYRRVDLKAREIFCSTTSRRGLLVSWWAAWIQCQHESIPFLHFSYCQFPLPQTDPNRPDAPNLHVVNQGRRDILLPHPSLCHTMDAPCIRPLLPSLSPPCPTGSSRWSRRLFRHRLLRHEGQSPPAGEAIRLPPPTHTIRPPSCN